jgi:hypothetical protein
MDDECGGLRLFVVVMRDFGDGSIGIFVLRSIAPRVLEWGYISFYISLPCLLAFFETHAGCSFVELCVKLATRRNA